MIAASHLTWNLARDFRDMAHYAFMRHAFVAGTIVAVLAGLIGYFVVLRQVSFAAHALSEIGFAGASAGLAYGFSTVLGLLGMTVVGAALIGALGKRVRERDAAIGAVLAFSLGLGSYFITRYNGNASGATGLLFGEIFGISVRDAWIVGIAGAVVIAILPFVYRPLLFASIDAEVAEARGVPVGGLSVVFLLLLAIAVTAAVQVVGVLLIFGLLVIPGAIASRVTRTPGGALATGVAISVALTWTALVVAFYSSFPVGFVITGLAFVCYLAVRVVTG